MGVYIPNMDKPKVCADCSVNDMVCGLWMEVANIKTHRHKDCPLIEIPTPHGRLKDVDKLESHEEFDGYGFTKSVYADDINEALTILEAEE